MKLTRTTRIGRVLLLTLFAAGLVVAGAQDVKPAPQAKTDAILGEWVLTIDAGGEYYYVSMTLALAEGKLAGKISESNGFFTDIPLTDLAWDGVTLKSKAVAPTPPDGAERLLETELKLAQGKWAGMMNIPDLGMAAAVTGAKK